MEPKERSIHKTAQEIIGHIAEAGWQDSWNRLQTQSPQCGFGKLRICCLNCSIGPCRTEEIEKDVGSKWAFESNPIKAAHMMIEHIESKRDALGINVDKERKLYDMVDRIALAI